MLELIILIIFVISFGGVLFILARNVPLLVSLSHNGTSGIKEHIRGHKISAWVRKTEKNIFSFFKKQIFLHKILSWTKVMALKVETRVDHLLHKIRKKAQQVDKK